MYKQRNEATKPSAIAWELYSKGYAMMMEQYPQQYATEFPVPDSFKNTSSVEILFDYSYDEGPVELMYRFTDGPRTWINIYWLLALRMFRCRAILSRHPLRTKPSRTINWLLSMR